MKYAISIVAIASVLVLASCASSQTPMMSSTANSVQMHLTQIGSPADMFYFRGPIGLQYQLTITNPTNQPLTLRRLNLSSQGPGAYAIRTGDTPMKYSIAPNSTTTISLSAWGQSAGGFLRGSEPVDIRGVAYFDSPSGSFVRQFVQVLPQE